MARGGPRQGQPNTQYPNRADMQKGPRQPAKAVSGQEYGKRKQQEAAQRAIPLPNAPTPGAAPGGMAATAGAVGGGSPGPVPSLGAPTARPGEPVTAGLSTGPGQGPEALNMPTQDDQILAVLRGMYQAFPNNDLARLIAELNARHRSAQHMHMHEPGIGRNQDFGGPESYQPSPPKQPIGDTQQALGTNMRRDIARASKRQSEGL